MYFTKSHHIAILNISIYRKWFYRIVTLSYVRKNLLSILMADLITEKYNHCNNWISLLFSWHSLLYSFFFANMLFINRCQFIVGSFVNISIFYRCRFSICNWQLIVVWVQLRLLMLAVRIAIHRNAISVDFMFCFGGHVTFAVEIAEQSEHKEILRYHNGNGPPRETTIVKNERAPMWHDHEELDLVGRNKLNKLLLLDNNNWF